MYADDHQCFETDKSVSTVKRKLQARAIEATNWYNSNSLKGNITKYGTMLMCRKNIDNDRVKVRC